jgi:hypothetical protein
MGRVVRLPLAFAPALLALLAPSSASAQRRGHRLHDGFYFRGSIGPGPGTVAFDQRSDWPNVPEGRVTGPGVASDLMIGGTPARGLAVGGALIATQAPEPDFDGDRLQMDANDDATWILIGPFVDFFFAPRKGFHLGAAAGLMAFSRRTRRCARK